MTTTTGDAGGYAFPHDEKDGGGQHWQTHYGMTLRDYFAAQAVMGIVAFAVPWDDLQRAGIASNAYAIADAMLEARKR